MRRWVPLRKDESNECLLAPIAVDTAQKAGEKKAATRAPPQEVLDNDDLAPPRTPGAEAYGNGAATPTSPPALDAATLQATFLLIP